MSPVGDFEDPFKPFQYAYSVLLIPSCERILRIVYVLLILQRPAQELMGSLPFISLEWCLVLKFVDFLAILENLASFSCTLTGCLQRLALVLLRDLPKEPTMRWGCGR